MDGEYVYPEVPTDLELGALALLLEGGMVAFPRIDGPSLATRRRAPYKVTKSDPSIDRENFYSSVNAHLDMDRFAIFKLLVEHGWVVTADDVNFAACNAPDDAKSLAFVDSLAAATGGSPVLAAMRCERRFVAEKTLARPGAQMPPFEAVAKLGKPWALALVSKGRKNATVSCISAQMIPNVAALLEGGADPNGRCADGVLPLTAALSVGSVAAARRLLDSGARGDLYSVYWAVVWQVNQASLRKYPRDEGAREAYVMGVADRKPPFGRSWVMDAVEVDAMLARVLSSGPIDLNAKDVKFAYGDSVLHLAARADLPDAVKQLVEAGAATDRTNDRSERPLDVAGPSASAVLRARGATGGDPVAIAAGRGQREAAEREEQDARERARERRQQRHAAEAAEERATQARERRERDERDAQARRDMPNTGVDTDALRRWALGGSQVTPKPSGNPNGVGREASAAPRTDRDREEAACRAERARQQPQKDACLKGCFDTKEATYKRCYSAFVEKPTGPARSAELASCNRAAKDAETACTKSCGSNMPTCGSQGTAR